MGRKKKIHWIWILFLGCILFIGPSALAANPNPLPLTAHPSDFVRVEGNHFVLGGQRWYPNGINYFPLNSIRIGETEKPRPNHWFSPGVYDPGAIEADLSLLRGLGMNMLALGLPSNPSCWANFTDFLERCQRYQFKIFLFLEMADPLGASFENLIAVLTDPTLDLPNRTQIFAYDIAWEPHLGDESSRSRWNGLFSRWLASTYGTLNAASSALGYPLPQSGGGYQANFIRYEMPIRIPAGGVFRGTFGVRNVGSTIWSRNEVRLGIRHDETRHPLPRDVSPNEEVEIPVYFNAPNAPGRYRYSLAMVQEGVRWFGGLEIEVEVTSREESELRRTVILPPSAVGPLDCRNEEYARRGEDPYRDSQLVKDGPWRQFVQAYRRAIDTEMSRRIGETVRLIKFYAPNQLVSARQGYGGNGSAGPSIIAHYPLDLASTGAHFDFLCPEGYEIGLDPYDSISEGVRSSIRSGMATTTAYARWASGGKPVVWVEFGYDLYRRWDPRALRPYDPYNPPSRELSNQRLYYSLFLDAMLESEAEGSAGWWYPGGIRLDEGSDYGIVSPARAERPVCSIYRQKSSALLSPRPVRTNAPPHTFDLLGGVRGYTDIYEAARPVALQTLNQGKRFVMQPQGSSTTSDSPLSFIGRWGATRDLWAEISEVELRAGNGGAWFKVMPGGVYAVPASTPIFVRARVRNLGPAAWVAGNVRFAANENFGLGFRWPIPRQIHRLEELLVPETPLTSGINQDTDVQFQMVAERRTWIDGSLRIRLVPIAQARTCQELCPAGARQCVSRDQYRVCGDYNQDGCTEWGEAQLCPSDQICQDGTCSHSPQCRTGEIWLQGACSPLALIKAKEGMDMSPASLPCPAGYELAGSWRTGPGERDGQAEGSEEGKPSIDAGVMWICSADPSKVKTVIAWDDCGDSRSMCPGAIQGLWHVGRSCEAGSKVSGSDAHQNHILAGWMGLCVSPGLGMKVEVDYNDCRGQCGSDRGCGGWRKLGAWHTDPNICSCESGRVRASTGKGASGEEIASGWMALCADSR